MRGAFFQLPPVLFVRDMVQTYGRLGVSRAAASLAYFLILTLFPLLVCVNFFIGLLELDPEAVFSALDPLLPRESLSIILEYLTYVSGIPQSQSTPLLLASLFTILLSASAGLRTLLKTMDELYQVRHVSSLRRVAVSVILSLLFLLTIYLSIVVIFTGDWFFQVLEERLPVPVVWNSGGYDRVDTLRGLEGKIQIYLPDLKYVTPEYAEQYSGAADYPEAAQAAILEMFRQTGPYRMENGLLKQGVLIRHLLLPGELENTRRVIDWVAETFRPGEVLFSLMAQYTPQPGAVGNLARHVTRAEYRAAVEYMENCGITDGYTQERTSAREEYTPDFDLRGI